MATSARIMFNLETLLLRIKWVILFYITFILFSLGIMTLNCNKNSVSSFRFSLRLHRRRVLHSYLLSLMGYLDSAFRKSPLGMLCQSGMLYM